MQKLVVLTLPSLSNISDAKEMITNMGFTPASEKDLLDWKEKNPDLQRSGHAPKRIAVPIPSKGYRDRNVWPCLANGQIVWLLAKAAKRETEFLAIKE